MNVESLRWWHWMIVGAIAGLVVGLGRLEASFERPIGGEDFISQAAFERELRLPPIMGRPYIKSMAIHPSRDIDLVSLSELDPETLEYRDRWYAAQRPYHALNSDADPAADYGVRDYLAGLADTRSGVAFRMAWWDSPKAVVIGWVLIGMAVIGAVWPPVLSLLIGAGWGRKKQEEPYDLGRFHHGLDAKTERRELSEEERRRLEELEAEMMAGMARSSDAAPHAAVRAAPQVVALAGQTAEISPEAPPQEKHYQGEYYPVEKMGGGE